MADLLPPSSRPVATDLFGDPIDASPSWLDKSAFLSPTFDPDPYLSSLRPFVPLESLRSELRSHLSSLESELVELINRDYSDFVSLSGRLVDVGPAVARMRGPLSEFRAKAEAFRATVAEVLTMLDDGLRKRAGAAAAREALEMLLDTFHVVSKVEKLIKELPTVPADGSTADAVSSERGPLSNGNLSQHVENPTNLRETQSILLERIASEMNRLKFYIAHAQEVPGSSPDKLVEDYEQIKGCIERDCKFLLDISSSANSGFHVFDFLANSILQEVLVAIQKGKPGALSPGRPVEFLKNYKGSLEFLSYLEADRFGEMICLEMGYCPSRSAVSKFRSEAVYNDFVKMWNVGVYFSLRFQEIAGALDSALVVPTIVPVQNAQSNDGGHNDLMLKQSIALVESLKSCWREDVFLLSCSDKFFRLSLQLVSRYSTWLSSGLAARKSHSGASNPIAEWAIAAAPEDFIYVLHDVAYLVTELNGEYLGHVTQLLSSCSPEVLDLVKHSILQGGKSLEDVVPAFMDTMIEAIVEKHFITHVG
ncbi:hypothetical protein QJS04_geneDACA012651 [Acorus gramineus]|uniref:Conserved oligomeric Golgi complex subunit 2 n=1 Tax=Acorus gramineus TaxID=55184 RepID=A0AAV9B7Y3_ACOGR|nr:hypothetical protein QJS04_geneDACA012651 [Acorus gramineus]